MSEVLILGTHSPGLVSSWSAVSKVNMNDVNCTSYPKPKYSGSGIWNVKWFWENGKNVFEN